MGFLKDIKKKMAKERAVKQIISRKAEPARLKERERQAIRLAKEEEKIRADAKIARLKQEVLPSKKKEISKAASSTLFGGLNESLPKGGSDFFGVPKGGFGEDFLTGKKPIAKKDKKKKKKGSKGKGKSITINFE